MSVIGHSSTILMFYIFTLIYCQWVAILLACFFSHDGGFWFGRYVVFDSFVTIHCSVYYDIVLILICLYTFFILYLYILSHWNICLDMACNLCFVTNWVSNRFLTLIWIWWMCSKWDDMIYDTYNTRTPTVKCYLHLCESADIIILQLKGVGLEC